MCWGAVSRRVPCFGLGSAGPTRVASHPGVTKGGPAQERGVSFGKSPCRQRAKLARLFLTVFPPELKFSMNVLELG